MVQFKEAALRFTRVHEHLKAHGPKSVNALYEIPEIKSVSTNLHSVRDILRTLRNKGMVRKIHAGAGPAQYLWEAVDINAAIPVASVLTRNIVDKTDYVQADTVGTAISPQGAYKQVSAAVIKPEVHVEADRIVITHPACNITIALFQ